MRSLIAMLFFLFTLVIGNTALFTDMRGLFLLWNAPSFLLVPLSAFFLAIVLTSWSAFINSLRIVFSNTNGVKLEEEHIEEVMIFLQVCGNVAILLGIMWTLVGLMLICAELTNLEALGPNLSVASLTIIYGMIVKVITYLTEKRIKIIHSLNIIPVANQ